MIKSLALIAALALGCFATAKADSISINGSDTYNSTTQTLTFQGMGSVGGTPNGIFGGFVDCYGCVVLQPAPLNYGAATFYPYDLFFVSQPGEDLLVTLETINTVDTTNGLTILGNAVISINGNLTDGVLTLTTQGGGDGTTGVTFSATTSPVPEPASLALFGTGLLGLVEIGRRKFNV